MKRKEAEFLRLKSIPSVSWSAEAFAMVELTSIFESMARMDVVSWYNGVKYTPSAVFQVH